MLSDVMSYFGLGREFDEAGYFETEHHRYLVKEIVATIKKNWRPSWRKMHNRFSPSDW